MGAYNAKIECQVKMAEATNTEYNPARDRWPVLPAEVVRGYDRQCKQIVKAVVAPGKTVNLSEYAGDGCKLLAAYNTSETTDVTMTVTIGAVACPIPLPAEEMIVIPTFDASTNLVFTTGSGTAEVELLVLFE